MNEVVDPSDEGTMNGENNTNLPGYSDTGRQIFNPNSYLSKYPEVQQILNLPVQSIPEFTHTLEFRSSFQLHFPGQSSLSSPAIGFKTDFLDNNDGFRLVFSNQKSCRRHEQNYGY